MRAKQVSQSLEQARRFAIVLISMRAKRLHLEVAAAVGFAIVLISMRAKRVVVWRSDALALP